jgi:hypothetical protein
VENYEDVIECLRKCFETEELSMDTIRSYYNALILVTKRKPNYECLPEFCAYTTERRSMAKVIRSVKTAEEPIPYEIDNIIEELEKRVRPLREKYPLTMMEEDAFMEFLLMKIFKHFPEDRTRYAGMTVYSRRNYDETKINCILGMNRYRKNLRMIWFAFSKKWEVESICFYRVIFARTGRENLSLHLILKK